MPNDVTCDWKLGMWSTVRSLMNVDSIVFVL